MAPRYTNVMVVLGFFLFLFGCGSSDLNSNTQPNLSTTQGKSILFATDGTMGYLSGYDAAKGTVVTVPCFNKVTNIAKDTSANPFANDYAYEMQMIESKTMLYDSLHASYQTEVGLLIAKNKIAVEMSNSFKHESSSLYVLVKSTWDGPAFLVNNPVFPQATKAEFLNLYPTYAAFSEACGNTFVYGIQTGMHFYGMFKFNFSSTSEKNRVHAALSGKTLTVKTKKELDNAMGMTTSSSNVTVMAKVLGGSSNALDIAGVRTVDDFFNFVDTYAVSEKKAIQDGKADGLKDPDPGLAYGYAINAVVVPYKSFISSQYDISTVDPFFTTELGSDWDNLAPIAKLFSDHKDAYNQLNFIVGNSNLFLSAVALDSSLTGSEITALTGYRDKFKASYEGIESLMRLCIEPDASHTIAPDTTYAPDVVGSFSGTSHLYCRTLYNCTADPTAAACAQCNTPVMCQLLWDKLRILNETGRMPFFTDSDLATLGVPAMGEIPRDCKSLQNAFPLLTSDGTYTVYFQGDADKPFSVDCEGMGTSAPTTYLRLNADYVSADAQGATRNYSMYGTLVGGAAGTPVYEKRAWTKYEIQTGSAGAAINIGNIIYSSHYDPNGLNFLNEAFRARSGYNQPASINLDLTGTGLAIRADNKIEVRGYGFYIDRPHFTFDYYLDSVNAGTYFEGMTAIIPKGDPAHISPGNTDAPALIWLDYVPRSYNVLDNPADRRHSGSKTLPLSIYEGSEWCNGRTTCPENAIFFRSIHDIFTLLN